MLSWIVMAVIFFICAFLVSGTGYACWHGVRALWRSRRVQGEDAAVLRLMGLNLCEPLANTFVFAAVMFFGASITYDAYPPFVTLLWAIAVAILPVTLVMISFLGLRGKLYDDIRGGLLGFSIGRSLFPGIVAMSLVLSEFSSSSDDSWCLFMMTASLSLGLIWWSGEWGRRHLNGVLYFPISLTYGPPPAPVVGPAPVSVPIMPAPDPSEALPDPGPAIPCPLCHTPTPRNARACPDCGLVFESRVPAALQHLADYHVLRPLGGGGMSSVYLTCERQSERLCVIKTLATVDSLSDPQWKEEAAACLRQEAALLRQLDHPHIAQVWDWVRSEQGDYLVLEYVPGATLEQPLTRPDGQGGTLPGAPLPLDEVVQHGITVAAILEYLAALPQPLVHHDIKPANLIVREEDGVLVLVDFGGAVLVPDHTDATVRLDSYGTPGYAAPEQYQGHSSPQSDIYGLAATLYHLLTDDDPTEHPFHFPRMPDLPDGVRSVLEPALAHEPAARPDARALRVALARLLPPA